MLTRFVPTDSSVSKVKSPSQIVSSAAYLLFFRRRSSVPLGGPRFAQICGDFDRSHDDTDEPGSGDDQQVGGSSLYGSSTAGKNEAGVVHLRGGSRGLDSGALGSKRHSVQASIEDEGVEMGESSNTTAAKAYKTEWSFGRLGGDEGEEDEGGKEERTALVDYASDDAQHDSGSEGRGSFMDADFPIPGGAGSGADEASDAT
ncbi:hypothetical protein IMZ48_44410, partial [Candidatus Bathyarchaeota archaeon]|nr:hypothetical protein [Candidatus Bathyarchaeota archaeon]